MEKTINLVRGNTTTPVHFTDWGQIREVIKSGNRFHEHTMLEAIASMRIPDGQFIDIGAHVGNHSIFFAKFLGRRVASIEASPVTFETLLDNVYKNNLRELITPLNLFIGESISGLVRFAHNEKRPGQSRRDDSGLNTVQAVQLPADRWTRVALIKIDVEGNEEEVIRCCKEIIFRDLPELFIETFGDPERLLSGLPESYKLIKRYNNAPTYHFSSKS